MIDYRDGGCSRCPCLWDFVRPSSRQRSRTLAQAQWVPPSQIRRGLSDRFSTRTGTSHDRGERTVIGVISLVRVSADSKSALNKLANRRPDSSRARFCRGQLAGDQGLAAAVGNPSELSMLAMVEKRLGGPGGVATDRLNNTGGSVVTRCYHRAGGWPTRRLANLEVSSARALPLAASRADADRGQATSRHDEPEDGRRGARSGRRCRTAQRCGACSAGSSRDRIVASGKCRPSTGATSPTAQPQVRRRAECSYETRRPSTQHRERLGQVMFHKQQPLRSTCIRDCIPQGVCTCRCKTSRNVDSSDLTRTTVQVTYVCCHSCGVFSEYLVVDMVEMMET